MLYSSFFLNLFSNFCVLSIISESLGFSVAYSNNLIKSSSLMYALIYGYICSTTDLAFANLNNTKISKLRLKTGGIALIYCVVNSKLH